MTKRLNIIESLGTVCVGVVLVIALGLAECGATEPVLGGSKTTATGAAGGSTAEGASSQLERCDESLGTISVVEDQTAPWYWTSDAI